LWSEQQGGYHLFTQDRPDHALLEIDEATWFSWLATHTSFSFRGKQGHLNLLKEARPRGEGYWYAYQRQGKRMRKHYLGRDSELTMARLEATAQLLSQACAPTPASQNGGQPTSLLLPKLRPPRLSSWLLSRPRLLEHLLQSRDSKLTLVLAPAGSGK